MALKLRNPIAYNPKTEVEKDIAVSSENMILTNYYQRGLNQESNELEDGDIFTDVVSKLDARIKDLNVKINNNKYKLPYATSVTLGGVRIGSNITNNSGTISITKNNIINALGYMPSSSDTTYNVFTKSGPDSSVGLVPAPPKVEGATKYLREDGKWEVPDGEKYEVFKGSGSDAAAGLVPAPSTMVGATKFLREDGNWAVPEDNDSKVTNVLNNSTKAYVTGTTAPDTNTGEQIFDSNIYIDTEEGRLHVKSIELGSGIIIGEQ